MTRYNRLISRAHEDEQAGANRQTASLAALALLLALVVVGLLLIRTLSAAGAIQDCLIAGRRDCDAVLAAQPRELPW